MLSPHWGITNHYILLLLHLVLVDPILPRLPLVAEVNVTCTHLGTPEMKGLSPRESIDEGNSIGESQAASCSHTGTHSN